MVFEQDYAWGHCIIFYTGWMFFLWYEVAHCQRGCESVEDCQRGCESLFLSKKSTHDTFSALTLPIVGRVFEEGAYREHKEGFG